MQHFASTQPQHQHHCETEQEFQRGPEHSHEAHQLQAAPDVFVVLLLERANLRLLLHVSADQPRARKVFLGARRNVGEHGLNAFEALVNSPAKILDHDAHHRQRKKSIESQPRTDRDHEGQSPSRVHHGIGRIHDGGAKQHPDGVQVVGSAGHDVAGAVALVVGERKTLQMLEQIVAQVKLNFARNADHDPTRQKLKDSLERRDGQQQACIEQQLVTGDALAQIVRCTADYQGKQDPDAVREENADRARRVTPAVAFEVRQERAQVLGHHCRFCR